MRFALFLLSLILSACTIGAEVAPVKVDKVEIDMGNPSKYYSRIPLVGKQGWQQSGFIKHKHPNRTVSMQADFPNAEVYTVQFGMKRPDPAALGEGNIRPTAEITWSVEGATIRRLVSVGYGVSVTGLGQGVKVVVRDTASTAGAADTDPEYFIQISVSPGPRANTQQPVIFVDPLSGFASPGPGAFVDIPVPEDIGVISLLVSGVTRPPRNVVPYIRGEFLDSLGAGISQFTMPANDFVPVPASAAVARIFGDADSAVPIGMGALGIFWGIDG